ncbi:MAG TPA: carboxypeptidase-like regulatory domain-containing protein, partial [Bryobacteraceae bacterium]|nr:carboxypeptidase-like regulatory domain-containing protein [Bryobacteraceae bacterium]
MSRFTIALMLAALAAFPVLAQQDVSGTIEGTVLDPAQGAIANAKVTLTNVDRNQVVRTTTTNAQGVFSAPLIPIGNYSLSVEASGFKTNTISGIVLNVHDDLKFNVTLEVGQINESINVTDQPTKVELSSVAIQNTITGAQVSGLPLASRNYEQLVALMPGVSANPTDELFVGVSSPSGLSAQIPFSVNGNRTSGNNWTVDGADNVDRGSNLTLMTFPSIDSIAQFKVQRSMYSAETGRAGGGQIEVVTKSGTAQFHGDLYEFFRNDVLAANNWINNADRVNVVNGKAKVPPLRWNDFGGTLGGPIVFNHSQYKAPKSFFFFSEEARRIVTYTSLQPTIPTSAMIAGNFPTPVCLTNNSPCTATSTTIAPSLINPVSAEYIKDIFSKIPLNAASTTAGVFPERNLFNSNQQIVRLDHTFNDKASVWFKFENDSIPTTEPGGLFTGSAIPGGAVTNTNSPGRAWVAHYLQTIRSTLLNEVGFNFTNSAIHSTPVGLTAKANSPDINVPLPYPDPEGVIPTLSFTGGTSIAGFGPYNEYNKNWAWYDTVNWQLGKHSLKLGVQFNRYNKTENAGSGQGSFSFTNTGAPTGTTSFNQSFANFLLGNVASFTQPSADITPDIWTWQTEAFVQDDYRLSPRLTVSLGVRWSYFGQPTESNGLLS